VRGQRLAVGVAAAHVAAAHIRGTGFAAMTTTMPTGMLATMTTTVLRAGRGGGVSGGGAAVRVLRKNQAAEAQHENEGQNNSDFISHCSILLGDHDQSVAVMGARRGKLPAQPASQAFSLVSSGQCNVRAIPGPAKSAGTFHIFKGISSAHAASDCGDYASSAKPPHKSTQEVGRMKDEERQKPGARSQKGERLQGSSFWTLTESIRRLLS
jgi:hypothetical protein